MIRQAALLGDIDRGAVFSPCERYRYRLWRRWGDAPCMAAVLMNCSTATADVNDATVERVQRRAQMMGFGGLEVVNAFAWRETDSRRLPGLVKRGVDIIGPDNDSAIMEACRHAGLVLCGWGRPGRLLGRDQVVLGLLRAAGLTPHALAINEDGSPVHPLYQSYAVQPRPMT